MKNIFDVLRQKESDLQQLQKEVEALRIAARLLADESDSDANRTTARVAMPPPTRVAQATPAAAPATSVREPQNSVWDKPLAQFP